jgi:hypothetical protein
MANTIDLVVTTNAVTVLNKTSEAAENTAKGFTSAKAELRALNNQLLTMDQTSEAFKVASKRAAELKDNISDLGAEINANAGNAFEGLSNNVGLFGSRLMSLDLKGAGQALSGMGAAVGRIDFKTLKEEVGGLTKGLANLGKAVLANPFFLAAGALAAMIVYYKEIGDLINGTAEKVKKLEESNVVLDKQNQILDARINKEKTLYGESSKTLELEKEKARNNISVAENELAIARTTGDINVIREKENKLIELRNLLSGITNKGEADRLKGIEKARELTIAGYKEEQERIKAIAEFEDLRAQQLGVIAQKQIQIKASLQTEALFGQQQYETERANFVQKDIETKQTLVQSDKQKQLQIELNKLLEEEKIIRNAKLAIATETTVEDLKAKDKQKEATEREKTQFQEIKSLGLQRIEVNEVVVNNIISQEEKLSKAIIESQKKVEQHQREITAKRLQMASDAFGALGALTMAFDAKSETAAKNQFKINKAFSLSQAIINTYQAVNAALTAGGNPAKLATGAQFVEAGIALTAGLASVVKIQQTKFGGAGVGGGSSIPTSGGGGGTTAPSPANFAFLGMQPNQQQPPLQAYVVGAQMSSNLEAQQLIQNQSRLGG